MDRKTQKYCSVKCSRTVYQHGRRGTRTEYTKRYYAKNRERQKGWARDWYRKNKARAAANNKRGWLAFKEKMRNSPKLRARQNELSRQYAARHPDRVSRAQRICGARRRKAPGDGWTKEYLAILMTRQRGRCVYCKAAFTETGYHVDHIVPLARGGLNDRTNIQLTCPNCNRRKTTKLPHEFAREMGMLL